MRGFFFDHNRTEVITTTKQNTNIREALALVGRQIGNTPLLQVNSLFVKEGVRIYAKAEWEQLSGSVKARAAFGIINEAVTSGKLHAGKILLDATSGNTGIAYATIGRAIGIRVALCLPENASAERKQILQELGAEIIYTSPFGGTDEAQQEAQHLASTYPDKYFYADQYKNHQNWRAHYDGTALEIFEALPQLTHFVAGLGTTGTFTGTARRLRQLNPNIQLVSLQPDLPMHGLEGWKHLETAIVPEIYDDTLAHRTIEVSTPEAYHIIAEAARKENWMLSPSAAANLAGAIKVAGEIERGTIVTILPDNADKYSEVIKSIL